MGKGDQIRYNYLVSPQCVLFGRRHISDDEGVVREISFILEHAVEMFHDPDAYGTIFNDSAATAMVARIGNPDSSIEVEDRNWISYYTGKKTAFTSDTKVGRVSANHTPVFTIGNDHDHGLKKVAELSIRFDEPLPVIESLRRMGRVLQFFDLIAGYTHNVTSISVHTGFDDPTHSFELYATGYAERQSTGEESESGRILRTSVLIHPVGDPIEFGNVLLGPGWTGMLIGALLELGFLMIGVTAFTTTIALLQRPTYSTCFRMKSMGASCLCLQILSAAVIASRKIFCDLPPSEERDDVLGYLGRVGGWRLKRKIRYRGGKYLQVYKSYFARLRNCNQRGSEPTESLRPRNSDPRSC